MNRQADKINRGFTGETDLDDACFTVMDARLLNVPDGRLLHDVPHLKPLDRLVLRRTSTRKAGATNESKTFQQARSTKARKPSRTSLTLGQHLAQLEQRMYLTWPRPCLLRPPLRRLKVCAQIAGKETNQLGAGRGKEREIEIADWELGLTMAAAREVES